MTHRSARRFAALTRPRASHESLIVSILIGAKQHAGPAVMTASTSPSITTPWQ
jgi:hypothetical protein